MRPAARLAAAIEVLETWNASGNTLESVLKDWGRTHRFAGAKDRAAISDRVYAVLRRRAECAWAIGVDTPRGWVLGSLVVEDGLDGDGIDAHLAGAPHAPAPLSPAERAALARPREVLPPWIAGGYPEWLDAELRRSLGDRLSAEMAANRERAPLDVRVNRLRGTRDEAVAALAAEGIVAQPLALLPEALRCPAGAPVVRTQAHAAGLVEVQDLGSQIAARLALAKPGELVVDLAAGAGGKALALAADMANRGRVVAFDIDRERLSRLLPRAQRASVQIVETEAVLEPGLAADLVFVDAPCSGSGTWRRHPDQKWRLTAEDLTRLAAVQAELLDRGAGLVRAGGRLVYVTCSMFRAENEAAIEGFCARHPAFRARPASDALARAHLTAISCSEGASAVSLSPVLTGTDGFFIAVLDRLDPGGIERGKRV